MYLPKQINACRAGFYSKLNGKHRKKIIKAPSVLTMVSNATSPIQAVQRDIMGGSESETTYLKSTKPDKVLFMATLES